MLRIRRELGTREMSHAELSRRTGIHTSTISRLVAGQIYPYPGWKRRLGEALGIDGDVLFEDLEDAGPSPEDPPEGERSD